MLVASAHELEEEDGACLANRQVADFVDDEQRGMAEYGESVCQGSGSSSLLERRDERSEGAVVNASSLLGGSDSKTDRQMSLADAGRSQQDNVLFALDEAELVKILDLLALDGRLEWRSRIPQSS